MRWHPIALGRGIRKAADRFGGCDLILPWPEGLPAGPALALDEERDATRDERAAAAAMIAAALPAGHGLIAQGVVVARLRRPLGPDIERAGEVADHLIPHLVAPRWASRKPRTGGGHWLPAGRIALINEARPEPGKVAAEDRSAAKAGLPSMRPGNAGNAATPTSMPSSAETRNGMPDTGDFAADLRAWMTARGLTRDRACAMLDYGRRTLDGVLDGGRKCSAAGPIRRLIAYLDGDPAVWR